MKHKKSNQGLAIVGLIVNILLLPGLGSMIGGKTGEGVAQLILFLLGVFFFSVGGVFSWVVIGLPFLLLSFILIPAAWIWALISGIRMVQEAA